MWFIGVEVEQETSALSPKKNPGSAPKSTTKRRYLQRYLEVRGNNYCQTFLRIAPTPRILLYLFVNIIFCYSITRANHRDKRNFCFNSQ